MRKIISIIAAVLLVGQVSYIHTLYAASSKNKHATSKKTDKHKSDKNNSKQADKSKATITPVANTTQKDNPGTETKTSDTTITTTQNGNPAPVVVPVDCLYHLAPNASISEKELAEWAQLAIVKSFNYSFDTLDTQLQKLKACYTEQGWLGFNDALKQSGNLATIKTQQLTVSCEIEGKLTVNPFKNNQWKITVPLKVVYQNTQEKLTQRLFIEMIVAKKSATQLGIVQIIAEPKSQTTS